MRTAIVTFAAVLIVTGCGMKEREITGQVFIVTKGRDNIKLALVEVVALPEKNPDVVTYFKTKHKDVVAGKITTEAKLKSVKKENDDAMSKWEREIERNTRLIKITEDHTESLDTRRAALRTLRANKDSVEKAISEMNATIIRQEELLKTYKVLSGPAFYFQELPAQLAAAKAKTDADGKFSMKLPQGEYVIAATSSRTASDKEDETYFWLVKVDATTTNQFIMLSNDNLVETSCAACFRPDKL